jgi:hypothetical protein
VDDLDQPPGAEARQLRIHPHPVAHQQDGGAIAGGANRALHRTLRRMISTHGVYGDRHARFPPTSKTPSEGRVTGSQDWA